jgi:6-pyruvoyltetrahydropterin/6-carboxytetrahydropterin synthase
VLDALGIAIDFREIKKQTKEVVKRLDHQYLNEIPPFDELNPTAENIAKYSQDPSFKISIKRDIWVPLTCSGNVTVIVKLPKL